MKKFILIFVLFTLIAGCSKSTPESTLPSGETPTPGLAPPEVQTTQAPDVEEAAIEYLESWKTNDYQAMYSMLNPSSQEAITEEEFSQIYHDVTVELAMESLEYSILSSFVDPSQAQVAISINYNSLLIDDLKRDIILLLSLNEGTWKVNWSRGLIFPELEGDNMLQLTRLVPSRGNIYDRNGSVIVAYADSISVGLTPSQIDPEREDKVLEELGRDLDMPPEVIYAMYEDYPPGVDWYLPLGAISLDSIEPRLGILESYTTTGVLLRTFDGRYYFNGGAAPQSVGYVR